MVVDRTGEPCEKGAELCKPGHCGCGRFVEVWNNVFMSDERQGNTVTELPRKNVDTGMGLERTLAILNGVESVYETSQFRPILERIIELSGLSEQAIRADAKKLRAIRILADHIRASTFIIGDEMGVKPSNQGQGYVLRRLIRRAIRFCETVGLSADDWVDLARIVIDQNGGQYPELQANGETILSELRMEKDRFEKTLAKGTRMLEKEIERLKQSGATRLEGEI